MKITDDPNPDIALKEAIWKLDLDGVRRAVEAGADIERHIERPGYTPMYVAAVTHHGAALEIVRFLIEAGARMDVVQGAHADGSGVTILGLAIGFWGHCSQIAQLLLRCGADPNFGPPSGRPIFIAHRTAAPVEWLLRYGTDLNIRNDEGQTPLEAYDEFVAYNAADLAKRGATMDWEEVEKIRGLLGGMKR